MNLRRRFLVFASTLLFSRPSPAQTAIAAMRFSALQPGAPLPEWLKPYTFPNRPRHTEFALIADEGRTVLRARAVASTSGLARELRVDPRSHPLLAWRWKVTNLILKSDLATRSGDDFPARLYVTFEGNSRALCYVWDSRLPVGTIAANAYSARVQMVVADSGAAELGRWVARERDVVADFRRAFGMEPPSISGVIVSADSDNTGESAESFFGDVEFRSRPTS